MWVVEDEIFWAWMTIALSLLIAIGYAVIAFNWYFQNKLPRTAESKAALARLRGICICCCLCGSILYWTEMPWLMWRIYDAILAIVVVRTWSFVMNMRGIGLVNERLAEADELERSARKYRQIAELLPHMVWTAGADGQIDFQNQRCHEYTGDERRWIDAVHVDDRLYARTEWEKAIRTREPMTVEVRLGGTSGYRTFVVKATPIVQGDAVRWLGACADIEDQKLLAAEKEMQARQKSFFLNALSHDLRAPLHNVLLNAHLLKLSARDPADVESVSMIMENVAAAGDLVTRLLDFAKVGAQDDNVVEPVSIAQVLQQVIRRFTLVAEQKGIYLRQSESPDIFVQTDRQKLERIVSNLVDNAIKYTRQGGVTLEIARRGTEVAIRICDSGIGIPPESVEYLFDEFYQVNNYERDRAKGFGMGLAICRCLARHLGGDVRLANTSREGSCFEVILQTIGADRRGRSLGEKGDHTTAADSGLCGV